MANFGCRCLVVFLVVSLHSGHSNVLGIFPKPLHKSPDSGQPGMVGKRHNISVTSLLKEGQEEKLIKKIRLEMIKQDILNKLQMKCRPPPMYSQRKLIPKPLYEGSISKGKTFVGDGDEDKAGTTQIVVPAQRALGTQVNSKCKKNSLCFGVRFSHRLCESKTVTYARLRLFKTVPSDSMPIQRISVYELGSDENDVRFVTRDSVLAPTSGWISLDMTQLIKDWVAKRSNNSSENHYLQVKCERCFSKLQFETSEESRERPYIVINVEDEATKTRRRRSLDCRPDTVECCRKLFYVSFAEIGWDDWIIQPLGFDANYCEGSCVGYVSPPNPHRSIMQRISNDKNLKTEFSPCCVATDMRSLPLLYFDEEGFIFKRDIPNMTVDSCGCS